VSRDGLVWDFKLRQGVKFHDGSELTAGDVVYSFSGCSQSAKLQPRRSCRS
jgi:ABC-type transport system substrate-binding protein